MREGLGKCLHQRSFLKTAFKEKCKETDFLDFVPWSESGTERGKRLWDFLPAKMLIAGSAIQLAV